MISRLKEYLEEEGFDFPDDPWQQLSMTIGGIEKCRTEPLHTSLTSKRLAEKNGNVQNIANIAFTVQAMVFGNLNDDSCTGIAASRQPITGKDSIYIEMAHKSQGPAVVTPSCDQKIHYKEVFKRMFPAQLESLKKSAKRLEVIYKDIRNIEFTIEVASEKELPANFAITLENAYLEPLDALNYRKSVRMEKNRGAFPFDRFLRLLRIKKAGTRHLSPSLPQHGFERWRNGGLLRI